MMIILDILLLNRLERAQEEHKTAVQEKQSIEAKLTDEISRAIQEAERLQEARHSDGGGSHSVTELEEKLRLAEEELTQVSNKLRENPFRNESQAFLPVRCN